MEIVALAVLAFIGLSLAVGYGFDGLGLKQFPDFPRALKRLLGLLWLFFAATWLSILLGDKNNPVEENYYPASPILRRLVFLTYFPLNAMLVRLLRWLYREKNENPLISLARGLSFIFTGLSIIACFLLFLLGIGYMMFQGAQWKPGG